MSSTDCTDATDSAPSVITMSAAIAAAAVGLPLQPSVDQTDVPSRKRPALDEGVDNKYRYRMDHEKRGLFIIINNKTFDRKTGMGERKGTDADAENLQEDFKRLNFDVRVYKDQKAAQMMNIMLDAAKTDHSKSDCIGVTVLTHGNDSVLYGTDGIIPTKVFLEPLKKCPTLVGKPKIFLIQACQGDNYDAGLPLIDDVDGGPTKRIPVEADVLCAYSTVPGYFAWRNAALGSWFVQALHKMIRLYVKEIDFARLLTRVSYEVAYEFESNTDSAATNHMKQVPSIVSTLTKEIHFG